MSGTDCLWCETQRVAARGVANYEFRCNDFGNLRPRMKPEENLISYSLIRGGNLRDNGTYSYVLSDSPHAWQHSIRPSYCNHLHGTICQPATIQLTRVLHFDFVEDGASTSDDLTTPTFWRGFGDCGFGLGWSPRLPTQVWG